MINLEKRDRSLSKRDNDFELGKKYRNEAVSVINVPLERIPSDNHLVRLHSSLDMMKIKDKEKNNTYYNRLRTDIESSLAMGMDYKLVNKVSGRSALMLFRHFPDFGLYIKLPKGYYETRQKAEEFLQFLYDLNAHVVFILRTFVIDDKGKEILKLKFSDPILLRSLIEYAGWSILTSRGNRNRLVVNINPKRITYRTLTEETKGFIYRPTVLEIFDGMLSDGYSWGLEI